MDVHTEAARHGLTALSRDDGERILFSLDGDPCNTVGIWHPGRGTFIEAMMTSGRIRFPKDAAEAVAMAVEAKGKVANRGPSRGGPCRE